MDQPTIRPLKYKDRAVFVPLWAKGCITTKAPLKSSRFQTLSNWLIRLTWHDNMTNVQFRSFQPAVFSRNLLPSSSLWCSLRCQFFVFKVVISILQNLRILNLACYVPDHWWPPGLITLLLRPRASSQDYWKTQDASPPQQAPCRVADRFHSPSAKRNGLLQPKLANCCGWWAMRGCNNSIKKIQKHPHLQATIGTAKHLVNGQRRCLNRSLAAFGRQTWSENWRFPQSWATKINTTFPETNSSPNRKVVFQLPTIHF